MNSIYWYDSTANLELHSSSLVSICSDLSSCPTGAQNEPASRESDGVAPFFADRHPRYDARRGRQSSRKRIATRGC
jgi:hypothetical protein